MWYHDKSNLPVMKVKLAGENGAKMVVDRFLLNFRVRAKFLAGIRRSLVRWVNDLR